MSFFRNTTWQDWDNIVIILNIAFHNISIWLSKRRWEVNLLSHIIRTFPISDWLRVNNPKHSLMHVKMDIGSQKIALSEMGRVDNNDNSVNCLYFCFKINILSHILCTTNKISFAWISVMTKPRAATAKAIIWPIDCGIPDSLANNTESSPRLSIIRAASITPLFGTVLKGEHYHSCIRPIACTDMYVIFSLPVNIKQNISIVSLFNALKNCKTQKGNTSFIRFATNLNPHVNEIIYLLDKSKTTISN